ncbi:MAG: hypothetical protein HXX81_04290 [Campylobacterales bacterium]|nr:hypothetical protein [Campylobacterales bacterium]
MKKILMYSLCIGAFLGGCGEVVENEEKIATEKPAATKITTNNTGNVENSIGYIGEATKFANVYITDGIWSVYLARDEKNQFDTYIMSYRFYNGGSLDRQVQYPGYSPLILEQWGVSKDGKLLTISPSTKYTYSGDFRNDCFSITGIDSGESAKLCKEKLIDDKKYSKNSFGYYGTGVKYGNYEYGNTEVVGKWNVYKTSNDGSIEKTASNSYTLNSDGTTADGSSWGVSQDGKILFINDKAYFVFKYYNDDCFNSFEYQNSKYTQTVKICKNK